MVTDLKNCKKFADIDEEELTTGIALVFPFGSKTKMASYKFWPKKASNISEIERIAVSTFPDRFEKLKFEDDKMDDFSDWIVSSFYESNPSRFKSIKIRFEIDKLIQQISCSMCSG